MSVHISTLADHTHKKFLKCVWCKYESTPFWFRTNEPFKYSCPICGGKVNTIPRLSEDAPKVSVRSGWWEHTIGE